MKNEQEIITPSAVETVFPEKLQIKQNALAEKLSVQLAVMRELGFLPSISGLSAQEAKVLSPEEEASAFELWTKEAKQKKDSSNAAIFNVLYQNIASNPEKLKLLRSNPDKIVKEIAVQMQAKESV